MVKKAVVKRIRELRKDPRFRRRKLLENDPKTPAFVGIASSIVKREPSERQLIAFRTPYCTYGKCTMCGFNLGGVPDTTLEDLKIQLSKVDLINHGRVSLCTESSFFHPKVPFEFLEILFEKISKTGIHEIDLESSASDVIANISRIKRLKEMLRPNQQLFVGMGLESEDEIVRNILIGKKLSKELFEQSIEMLAGINVGVYAYIILKPPGLEEKEAVEDCIRTIEYFFRVANEKGASPSRATVKPLFIAQGTIVEALFEEGLITPPRLWSMIKVLEATHTLGTIFVPLTDEGVSNGRIAENCPKCTEEVRDSIRTFNANQKIEPLLELSCECKEDE